MRRHPKAIVATAFATLLTLALGVSLATATAPVVTIEAASGVGYVTATAKGTVDPGDHETSYRFRYATQAQFEASEFTEAASSEELSLPEGSGPTPVQAELSGLAPNTTYHLRLEAANSDGTRQAVAPETFTTKEVARPSVSIDAPSSITTSSAQLSGQVNPNGTDPAFDTHWEIECAPSCFDFFDPQRQGDIPADESNHPVAAEATGLQPGTEYTLTLSATNAGGTETAQTAFTTEAAAPSINALASTADVSQSAATLKAKVDPNGAETTYRFEWGTDASYGNIVPVPEEAIGAGSEPVEVSAPISGLSPDTAYHYRVVASNSAGTSEGADHEFRTWPVPEGVKPGKYPGQGFLPDNRAWEMVSPPGKNGGEVTLGRGSIRASSVGDAVVFDSNVPFGNPKGTGAIGIVSYRATRDENMWSHKALFPVQTVNLGALFSGPVFHWFTSDLSAGILQAADPPLTPDAPEHLPNLYLTGDASDSPRLLTPNQSGGSLTYTELFPPSVFADASTDLRHILFQSRLALTPDAQADTPQVYEWNQGFLSLVGILPPNSCDTPPCVAEAGAVAGFALGTDGGSALAHREETMSEDGARIYFASPPSENKGKLYLRKNAVETVMVSESEASDPDAERRAAHFWAASADGQRMVFSSGERLLDADLNPSSDFAVGGETSDVYMYTDGPHPDAEANLTLISTDHEPADGVNPGAQGVLGASVDGSYVYFEADRRIVSDQDPVLEAAPAIYVWHQGTVEFVASIKSIERFNWEQLASERTARVTPNGRYLVFTTRLAQPGGYDNAGHSEIYLYDASLQVTRCVSCNPSGEAGASDATLTPPSVGATGQYTNYESRTLSVSGSRVFFNTADALVSEDSNGRIDVYEWEEKGSGSCHKVQGCLYLISSGKGTGDSLFGDASANGKDVYFVTENPLSAWDSKDGYERDLYRATVDGGLPEPPTTLPSCAGDACQPPPVPLNDVTPSSASFGGSGRTTRKRTRNMHKRTRNRHKKGHRNGRHRGHSGKRIPKAALGERKHDR